jgi:hypothetical protein
MLGNFFNSKKKSQEVDENSHTVERIAKMNLSDMRSYVRNNIKDFEVSEFGLQEIMHRLTLRDEHTEKFYINSDDMSTKKKKAFDLVILIANNKKITVDTVEQIQKFLEVYKDIIEAYDREFKEIYESRFNDALNMAIGNVNELTKFQNKMSVLGE